MKKSAYWARVKGQNLKFTNNYLYYNFSSSSRSRSSTSTSNTSSTIIIIIRCVQKRTVIASDALFQRSVFQGTAGKGRHFAGNTNVRLNCNSFLFFQFPPPPPPMLIVHNGNHWECFTSVHAHDSLYGLVWFVNKNIIIQIVEKKHTFQVQ
jgi:hypothetical protein